MKNKVIIFMFGFLVVCCNLFAYATYSCYSPEGNYLGFTNVLDDEKISTVYSIEGKAIGYINFNSYPGRYYNTQ
ncbi:MAG: hypothetical protein PHV17_06240, partial [Candidatus Omnitrophica bacterium]|nr:hypothetical protein [Candidatus Omnitrophota bacterium]